ncbi:ribonuclease Z [Candidatus Pacearchaeota archaeon]|nr:ribonuclease Z [Candidatus Pacearchaeota archaeon]
MKINITFLGTSSSIPTKTRNHMAILVNYKDENILIDCGEGTQRQFRKKKINPCKLTRLLITHFHGDHIFGLQGLFQTLALNDYRKTLQIYGPIGTKDYIKKTFSTYINTKRINYEVHEVKGTFIKTNDFQLTAIPLEHDCPTNGYKFEELDKLRIDKSKLKKLKIDRKNPKLAKIAKGKDITINKKTIKAKTLTYIQKGKTISFIFDTKLCNNTNKLAKDSDLAIIEGTFLEENSGIDLAKEYMHLTAKQAAEIAKKSGVKKLIITHISQRYEHKENLLLKEAKKVFPNTIIAEDFMEVEV